MPTEHTNVSTCAKCGAIRSDDWMADVDGKSYCLPNGSPGTPGNVDHRPKRETPEECLSVPERAS